MLIPFRDFCTIIETRTSDEVFGFLFLVSGYLSGGNRIH